MVARREEIGLISVISVTSRCAGRLWGRRRIHGHARTLLANVAAALVALGLPACQGHSGPSAVVLITMDTTRADYIGCFRALGIVGHEVDDVVATPVLDAFAREAVVFTNATTPVPITAPAHASLLTGLYPGGHGIFANGTMVLDPEVTTIAEDLGARGFLCGAFLSAFVLNGQCGLSRGFDRYDDDVVTERTADATTDLALAWLADQSGDRPLFLWVHYFDPHRPYEPPDTGDGAADPYAAEITHMDGAIGRLFDGLRGVGLYEDALVIVASDHGEGLGDHGEEEHGVFLYDEVVRVPLMIKPAARVRVVPVTGTVDAAVSLVDVVPTVHDLLDVDRTRPLHGYSLVPLIEGTGQRGEGSGQGTDPRAVWLETRYPEMSLGWSRLEGVRTRRWKYIRAPREELYDLASDPSERTNVAAVHPDTLARLAGLERRLHRKFDLDREPGPREEPTSEELARLRSLGYLGPSPAPKRRDDLPDPKDMMGLYEHFEQGKRLAEEKRWAEAHDEFEKILSAAPDNFVALFYSAIAAGNLDRSDDAKARYLRILELDPGNAQASYSLGQILLAEGAYDAAEQRLEAALHDDVYAARTTVLLAQSAAARGDLERAHTLAARGLGPGEVGDRAIRVMALASVRLGRFERANAELREALARFPDDAQLHAALGATLMLREGLAGDPEQHLRRATELDPDNPFHHYNLACYLSRDHRAGEAIASLERSIRLGYDDRRALETDPDLEAARHEPGFESLLDEISVPTPDR